MNVIIVLCPPTLQFKYQEGKRGNAVDFLSTKKLDQVF
jgi:hypothetical protein